MKWSWKLGRVAGIDVRVHATFLVLLAWVALAYYRESGTVRAAIGGVAFILALFASVVLHEFGHALGLIHEHQNPKNAIKWNKPAVIQDLSGPPNNWDTAKIQHNMFDNYDPAKVTATTVDSQSIMMYPIPKTWTLDGFSAGLNRDLSPTDKQLIHRVYPGA
jgi:hypothetical protein